MPSAASRPDSAPCLRCGSLRFRNASGKVYCKVCANRVTREWRVANNPEVTARQRERHAANREADNARAAAYYATHRDRWDTYTAEWRAANRDKVRAAARKYAAANPHKYREHASKRRARKMAAVCKHGPKCVTASAFRAVDGQLCVYCGAAAEHADHYIPLSRGGLHCRENIVPACARCNKSKNNRLPDEWHGLLRSAS